LARLDVALVALHPGLSRRQAREAIEKGQVTVDGRLVREPGHPVAEGADVLWDPHRKALSRARLSLPRLFEDEALLVVDKPAGLLSVPTSPTAPGEEDTALLRVQEYARRRHPRRPYVGRVHRLDRDTSGALAFALSTEARAGLIALFRAHRVERRYLALVEGDPRAEQGVVDLPIHDAYEGGRRRLARPGEPSHPARTRWRVVQRLADAALLEVELDTGRQHQIRLHLAHLGLPVLGDAVYRRRSGEPSLEAPRQMLHAAVLGFDHPLTGAPVRAESPLPPDFQAVLTALRRRAPRAPGPARKAPRPR
jgi:23S rRNA pseudouridine1911/1915/1917 synthase